MNAIPVDSADSNAVSKWVWIQKVSRNGLTAILWLVKEELYLKYIKLQNNLLYDRSLALVGVNWSRCHINQFFHSSIEPILNCFFAEKIYNHGIRKIFQEMISYKTNNFAFYITLTFTFTLLSKKSSFAEKKFKKLNKDEKWNTKYLDKIPSSIFSCPSGSRCYWSALPDQGATTKIYIWWRKLWWSNNHGGLES